MDNKAKSRYIILYDIVVFAALFVSLYFLHGKGAGITPDVIYIQAAITFVCIFGARLIGKVYKQILRYGGIQGYIRLLTVDTCGFLINLMIQKLSPIPHVSGAFLLIVSSMNLLCAMAMRMLYRYAYKCADKTTPIGKFLNFLLRTFAGIKLREEKLDDMQKMNIAIIGAGSIGVALVEELRSNPNSRYAPQCFVDTNKEKINRSILDIPVLPEDEHIFDKLAEMDIDEVVFAINDIDDERAKSLHESYFKNGFKIKVYDYPLMQSVGGKRRVRDFNIEELLFRKPIIIHNEKTEEYYSGKTIMITGGGGSIGSELCRQLAKLSPKKIVIVDIYENGAYDVQQELKIAYGNKLDISVEIASICHRRAMERVFEKHHPQIIINAAAHKHVPLMENNCIEAVENNVFGTKTLVELCEEYGVESFVMVSTDKAVNPTNVMGATKRMCEMIVQSASTHGKVKFSATRFGNVLGSAGSVIPLFRRQITNGGPITLTDKRIIRYFMTIPEAAQLVLESGAIAKNGELFVLDMGRPVKIYDLAKNMIRLMGAGDIEIIETGLRPGEKLYEELLVKTEELDKTENKLIFIERDAPCGVSEINEKLEILTEAIKTNDDEAVKIALKQTVPTYKTPEEVNSDAEKATGGMVNV